MVQHQLKKTSGIEIFQLEKERVVIAVGMIHANA
jgi:hypothetical protein